MCIFIYHINGFRLLLRCTCKMFLLVFQQCSLRNFDVSEILKRTQYSYNCESLINFALHIILYFCLYIFFTPSIISQLGCSVL